MYKKCVVILSVTTTILLALCALLFAGVKSANDEIYALSNSADALKNANIILKSENGRLRETIEAIRQENNKAAETSDLPQQEEDTFIEAMFEANPIDSYFLETAKKIVPTTTAEMMEYGLLHSLAWEAEMINCYDILKSKTKYEAVINCLDADRDSYIEYIKNDAELEILFEASGAFIDEEYFTVGTISHVLRPSAWSRGYRKKTLELFQYLHEIDVTPQFIFSEEKYNEQIQQTFPERN